jgi:glucosamine--fructose-6-phosphate aminotransferase (isomerizing)
MSLRSELQEGPEVVARLLGDAREELGRLARDIRDRDVAHVLIAARGTSDHAAIYAQYVLGARNGLPVALAAPSLTSVYGRPPRLRDTLVIGISQSGKSPDIVAVIDDARRQGALTAAFTNDPASELAVAADHLVALRAGPEFAVAATKTYLAEIAALAMLSVVLDDPDGIAAAELDALPASLRAALDAEDAIVPLAAARAGMDRCIVLGRGFQYATAREWALKIKELSYVLADPYSAADFQHGPFALVEAGFPVLAVATTGPALDGIAALMRRVRDAHGDLLVISDDPATRAIGADAIPVPSVPEWLAPLAAIIPAQLFAYHLALARGLDTEAPRNISKVTLTR